MARRTGYGFGGLRRLLSEIKGLESYGIHFRKTKGEYVWTRARGTRNIKKLFLALGKRGKEGFYKTMSLLL